MWIPQNEEEIRAVVTAGSLEEGPTFDAKKELPSKNQEIAKDVAAMANDGGVLIYGIDEDEHGRPTILSPIVLAGQAERITAIIQTSIAEPPKVSILTIQTADDPSRGFLIVAVPPSERAPHMVVVKGDNRYYGRTATGNAALSEGDVARLYERRRRWDIDRDALLEAEVNRSPLEPRSDFAYLYLIAQPVIQNEDLLNRAVREGQTPQGVLHALVEQVSSGTVFPQNYSPDFGTSGRWEQRVEGFLTRFGYPPNTDDPDAPASTLNLQVDFNGTAHLFCGRAAQQHGEALAFFHELVAGNTTRFLTLLGLLYNQARYIGMVDVGVALTGLKGSIMYTTDIITRARQTQYDRDQYRKTMRVSALALKDDPRATAKSLVSPLFNAMSQGRVDPFRISGQGS